MGSGAAGTLGYRGNHGNRLRVPPSDSTQRSSESPGHLLQVHVLLLLLDVPLGRFLCGLIRHGNECPVIISPPPWRSWKTSRAAKVLGSSARQPDDHQTDATGSSEERRDRGSHSSGLVSVPPVVVSWIRSSLNSLRRLRLTRNSEKPLAGAFGD